MSEIDPLDDRWFVVSAEEWSALQVRLNEPARVLPKLAALLAEPAPWGES